MYLDRHFDNKHQDTIEVKYYIHVNSIIVLYYSQFDHSCLCRQANRTTCLADLCPLFGCSEQNTHYRGSGGRASSGAFSKLHPCSDEEVERYVYKCEVLSRR